MNEDTIKTTNEKALRCCVKNCQKSLSDDEMEVNGKYFCKICGTAYYKSVLGL
jgi:hypothetical protein